MSGSMGHRVFMETERDSTLYYVIPLASAFFFLIFKFFSPYVSQKIYKDYKLLSEGERVNWDVRVVSTVHSVLVCIPCVYSQLFDHTMKNTLIWYDCPVVRSNCAVVIGFLSLDLVLMTVYYKHMGEVGFYFHHAASTFAYYFIVSYDVMPYFGNFRLLSELSTPFLNNRWFLLTMKTKKTSTPFVVNGIVFIAVFFLCRIVTIFPFWYSVYLASQMEDFQYMRPIPEFLVLTCVTLDVLNIYWFYKLMRGLLKMMPELLGHKSSANSEGSRQGKRIKSG